MHSTHVPSCNKSTDCCQNACSSSESLEDTIQFSVTVLWNKLELYKFRIHTSFTIDFPPASGCGPHSCPVIPVTLELPHQELNALCNHRLPPNSLYDTASYKKWNISKDISKLVSDEKKWGKHEYLGKGMCSLIRQLCSNFKLFEKDSSSLFGHSNFGPGQIYTP